MSFEIKIPAVGESITSGVIAEWHKRDGEAVSKGDLLLTLDTDKVSTEITAEQSGVLQIDVAADEEVEIGAVVGHIQEADPDDRPDTPPDRDGDDGEEGDDDGEEGARQDEEGEPEPSGEASESVPKKEPAPATKRAKKGSGSKRKPAPAAKASSESETRMVPDLTVVVPAEDDDDAPPEANGDQPGRFTRKKMSPLRRKIAAQLVNAQQTAAMLTTFNEADMGAVMTLRKELQEGFVAKHGTKLGFMSFFIKAVVQGLKDVPVVNARIDGNDVITHHFYDIGVAVGTDKGLMVPVLRDCDKKSFAELEKEIIDFATRAREGKIQLEDLSGGVFTISNGGVYGSLLSTPILNPPQSGILGMHTIQERPVAVEGRVEIRPMMNLALSYDHRIVDGKEAVTFLVRVKEYIEHPARLLVGA
ncbi:2-oxoglutarate dehydrogenase complex dihydrolipoyllysine-residue succinyltransferase [soil metagenome]